MVQRGRPRSERARSAILRAARELLEQSPYPAVTIESIAARAGASKATIYRWWPNKAAVVTDCFLELIAPEVHFVDTGSVREDLRREMQRLAQVLASESGGIIAALIAEGQSDPESARSFREHWISRRREETRRALRRGVERGELRPDIDFEVAIDALYGPIYWRLLAGHIPLEEEFVDALVDHVMRGLYAPRETSPGG
jgi:AcrR family transcriptional regulator